MQHCQKIRSRLYNECIHGGESGRKNIETEWCLSQAGTLHVILHSFPNLVQLRVLRPDGSILGPPPALLLLLILHLCRSPFSSHVIRSFPPLWHSHNSDPAALTALLFLELCVPSCWPSGLCSDVILSEKHPGPSPYPSCPLDPPYLLPQCFCQAPYISFLG